MEQSVRQCWFKSNAVEQTSMRNGWFDKDGHNGDVAAQKPFRMSNLLSSMVVG
jgi:hypothetical protein